MLFTSFPADTGFAGFAAAFALFFPADPAGAGFPVLFAAFPAGAPLVTFFVKAPDDTGHIMAESFANKVLFYLFNAVFKDWDLPMAIFGKGVQSKEKYAFKDFFYAQKVTEGGKDYHPGDVKEEVVAEFIERQELDGTKMVGMPLANPIPPAAQVPAPAQPQ